MSGICGMAFQAGGTMHLIRKAISRSLPFGVVFFSLAGVACGETKQLGASLSLWACVPFAGILLSIAILPLLAAEFWHHHYGKVALGWALLFVVPFAIYHGVGEAFEEVLHTYVLEFIPFIILLWALYTVSGGIRIKGRLKGSPLLNTAILLIGTLLASWMGTTGAAMLLIRPLVRANAGRRYRVHQVVFFIFLVANIGGCLTPLGDPPLFLGFLKGVGFFWTVAHLLVPMFVATGLLLVAFFVLDTLLMKKEGEQGAAPEQAAEALGIEGGLNLLFLLGMIAAILYSGSALKDPTYFDAQVIAAARPAVATLQERIKEDEERIQQAPGKERPALVKDLLVSRGELNALNEEAEHKATRGLRLTSHVTLPYINLVRDGVLVLMGLLSLLLTAGETRRKNDFTWFPIVEVTKLFAGIFVTIIPAIAILKAGPLGSLDAVVSAVTSSDGSAVNTMYFWLTGSLSSFLDNAPTYLVFFNTAGGNAHFLMTEGAHTLMAVSAGAVFFGAMTYIGNAPNFMVRSIAAEAGVPMPSFFGYMLKWSLPFLVPTFILLTVLFVV